MNRSGFRGIGMFTRLRRFRRDEGGSLIIFSLFIFVLILMAGGMAVDLMRYESMRTNVQNTLDRAILAAASLDQTVDAQTVVDDYFAKAGLSRFNPVTTDDTDDLTYSTVSTTATANMPTMFMKNLGIPTLAAMMQGRAQERISDIEISLVLDISNSMNGSRRLQNLKVAARDFIDTIFDSAQEGTVAVSIIPYNTQVNVGRDILKHYTTVHGHDHSHCVDFDAADFRTVIIETNLALKQTAHFDPVSQYSSNRNGEYNITPSWFPCDPRPSSRVLPLSGSRDDLKDAIESLIASGNTSTEIGVKWGAALLDPSFRPVTQGLVHDGVIDADFAHRPVNYSDSQTLKVIVLMTDGANTTQWYQSDSYSSGMSRVWRDPNGRLSVLRDTSTCNKIPTPTNSKCFYRVRAGGNHDTADGGNAAVRMSYPDLWALYTTDYVARLHGWAANSNSTYNSFRNATSNNTVSGSTKNTRMGQICSQAKSRDIVIFSIGFEITNASAVHMANCASSESHFYRVAGTQLATAFAEIANKISRLRLVQ